MICGGDAWPRAIATAPGASTQTAATSHDVNPFGFCILISTT